MATPNLTSSTPHLSHHLSDPTFTPIITSSSSPAQTQALTSLTGTALTAYDAASRLGLGVPQRIMIETTSGPLILHSYLPPSRPSPHTHPQSPSPSPSTILSTARENLRPLSRSSESESQVVNVNGVADSDLEEGSSEGSGTLLIGTIVARTATAESVDARRAAARLERVGREFQREWVVARRDRGDEEGEG